MASKEKEREREKEKEKEKDKERERELEMEAALYTNCLLLGLDVSILGQGGMPRSGLFKHSNPRMGETLLHFLLSALRGPAQSAKVSETFFLFFQQTTYNFSLSLSLSLYSDIFSVIIGVVYRILLVCGLFLMQDNLEILGR